MSFDCLRLLTGMSPRHAPAPGARPGWACADESCCGWYALATVRAVKASQISKKTSTRPPPSGIRTPGTTYCRTNRIKASLAVEPNAGVPTPRAAPADDDRWPDRPGFLPPNVRGSATWSVTAARPRADAARGPFRPLDCSGHRGSGWPGRPSAERISGTVRRGPARVPGPGWPALGKPLRPDPVHEDPDHPNAPGRGTAAPPRDARPLCHVRWS